MYRNSFAALAAACILSPVASGQGVTETKIVTIVPAARLGNGSVADRVAPVLALVGRSQANLFSRAMPLLGLPSLGSPSLPLALLTGGSSGPQSVCNPVVLSFDRDPPIYGTNDFGSVIVTGIPGTVAILLFDTDPGPTPIPGIGLVRIGFSRNFASEALPPLPASGHVECLFKTPCPPTADVTVYLHAVSIDPSTYTFCLSNAISMTFRKTCASSELGQASAYGALQLGGDEVRISSGGVKGDMGVGPNGSFNMSGPSFVTGSLRLSAGVAFSQSGSSTIGSIVNNANLSQPIQDALAAAAKAKARLCTQSFTVLDTTQTITGVAGMNVICVGSIKLSGGKVITLTGPAGAKFTVNITDEFKMSGGSSVQVTGAVSSQDVIFNMIGPGTGIEFTGSSSAAGSLLATERAVSLSGGIVLGQVIAGRKINIASGAQVVCPCQ